MLGIGRGELLRILLLKDIKKNCSERQCLRDQESPSPRGVWKKCFWSACFLGGFVGFVVVMVFCFVSSWWCFGLPLKNFYSGTSHTLWSHTQGIPVFPGIPKQQRLNLPGLVSFRGSLIPTCVLQLRWLSRRSAEQVPSDCFLLVSNYLILNYQKDMTDLLGLDRNLRLSTFPM